MPMRRAVIAALLLTAAATTPAAALAPGAPRHVRTARAADAAARPGALSEDWMVELVDPRSKAYVALRVYRNPDQGQGARLELSRGGDGLVADAIPFAPAIQRSGRAWTIRFSSASSDGEIRLARPRPGVTAQRWGLG